MVIIKVDGYRFLKYLQAILEALKKNQPPWIPWLSGFATNLLTFCAHFWTLSSLNLPFFKTFSTSCVNARFVCNDLLSKLCHRLTNQ